MTRLERLKAFEEFLTRRRPPGGWTAALQAGYGPQELGEERSYLQAVEMFATDLRFAIAALELAESIRVPGRDTKS